MPNYTVPNQLLTSLDKAIEKVRSLGEQVDSRKKQLLEKELSNLKRLLLKLHLLGEMSEHEICGNIKPIREKALINHAVELTHHDNTNRWLWGNKLLIGFDVLAGTALTVIASIALSENSKANDLRQNTAVMQTDKDIWSHTSNVIWLSGLAGTIGFFYGTSFRPLLSHFLMDKKKENINHGEKLVSVWEDFIKDVKSILDSYKRRIVGQKRLLLDEIERLEFEVIGLQEELFEARSDPAIEFGDFPLVPTLTTHDNFRSLEALRNSLLGNKQQLNAYKVRMENFVNNLKQSFTITSGGRVQSNERIDIPTVNPTPPNMRQRL